MSGSSDQAVRSRYALRPEALPTAESLHFITFSCHHRLPYLADPASKNLAEQLLERTRTRHQARIDAYVFMPEHVHLRINEPPAILLSLFLKSFKQETSKKLKGSRDHFWQPRYYDFNVHTPEKRTEKIRYIHRNPVHRGLVSSPVLYRWSSYTHYATGEAGTVEIESEWVGNQRNEPGSRRTATSPPEAGAPFITAVS